MAVSPDFYGANRFTAYPFTREHEPFTHAFIDAQIAVENPYVGTDIRLVYALIDGGSPRKVEIVSNSTILISRDDAVTVEVLGAYEVLTVAGDHGQATIVIKPDEVSGEYDDSTGLLFIEYVLGGIGGGELTAVHSDSVEVAGPGQLLSLVLGANMGAEIVSGVLVLSAQYRDDGPCTPVIAPTNSGILTINGLSPNSEGNFQISPQSGNVVLIDNYPELRKISVLNTGKACCDCDDYVRFFDFAVTSHERLLSVRSWTLSNQTRYTAFNNYLKFLMRMEIVDGDLDGDWEAECIP